MGARPPLAPPAQLVHPVDLRHLGRRPLRRPRLALVQPRVLVQEVDARRKAYFFVCSRSFPRWLRSIGTRRRAGLASAPSLAHKRRSLIIVIPHKHLFLSV